MGEVYRGYDARLDRPVALKRVSAAGRARARYRKRFRREARSLARIHHAHVVAIFDWVEADSGDWLVMELIEGEPLHEIMREGPLPYEEVLRIAREIASGLAAIHAQGIVHRDLKPSNIMLLPAAGQVKIIDFGLAKRIETEDGVPLSETLSERGQILGTVRFMSPEQASGQKLDGRSDLFSLGVLLYEMLSGVSPFRGENIVSTLARICTVREVPLQRHVQDLPLAVSELVRRLLEKDPDRRISSAREVVDTLERLLTGVVADDSESELLEALSPFEGPIIRHRVRPGAASSEAKPSPAVESTLVRQSTIVGGADEESATEPAVFEAAGARGRAAGARARLGLPAAVLGLSALSIAALLALSWKLLPISAPQALLYVAVPRTTVAQPGAEDAGERRLEAAAIEAGVLRALLDLRGVAAVQPGSGDAEPDDPKSLASALAVEEVLTSELDCSARTCQVSLRRLAGADGRVLGEGRLTFAASSASLLDTSLSVADQIRFIYSELPRRYGVAAPRVSAQDYERFLALRQRFHVRGSAGEDPSFDLERELEAIRRSSPEFVSVYQFATTYWTGRFHETRQATDLEKARAALAAGQQIAPDDPRIAMAAFQLHLVVGELDMARSSLDSLAAREPGDAHVLVLRHRLLAQEGRKEEALSLLDQAIARRPSWSYYAHLAALHREMGRLDAARQAVERLLERAPESYFGQSRAAELEILSGHIDRAVELYEQVVARRKEPTELSNLGTAYLLQGRFEKAAETYRELAGMVPASAPALLNLADAERLCEDPGAEEHYRRVVELTSSDPDPAALLSVKAQALAHLGEREAAVQAILEALRRYPEDPKIAFEASLVYAIVGETTSALLHARRALESGVSRVWFDIPWFDPIRDSLPPRG